jgi:hypothetical protein
MSELSENITIELFGLEKDLWAKTMDTERTVYGTAMWCYMAFLVLACISSCMLVFLITGNIFSSIFGGILVTLIIGSIVRFSMIILRRSIFDEIKVKQNTTPIVAKQTEVNNTTVVTPSTNKVSKLRSLFRKVKFSWPTSHSKVPGFAGLIRLVIMTVMGLLVLFPLATLLHKSSIDELNDQKRVFYKQEFEKDANVALVNSLSLLNKEKSLIDEDLIKNADIYQTDGLVREKRQAIARIDSLIVVEKASHEERYAIQYDHFLDELEGQYFIALSFKAVVKMPFFYVSLLLIFFLLTYPHLLLYRLKTNQSYSYSSESTKRYRENIDTSYKQTTAEGYALLKKKYGYDRGGYNVDVYWENPPYNTIPHQPFAERTKVKKEVILQSLEPKITA